MLLHEINKPLAVPGEAVVLECAEVRRGMDKDEMVLITLNEWHEIINLFSLHASLRLILMIGAGKLMDVRDKFFFGVVYKNEAVPAYIKIKIKGPEKMREAFRSAIAYVMIADTANNGNSSILKKTDHVHVLRIPTATGEVTDMNNKIEFN